MTILVSISSSQILQSTNRNSQTTGIVKLTGVSKSVDDDLGVGFQQREAQVLERQRRVGRLDERQPEGAGQGRLDGVPGQLRIAFRRVAVAWVRKTGYVKGCM